MLCTFWRGHVLRTASAFFNLHPSKSGPKLSCFFFVLTWTCASRRNGVHFPRFIRSKVVHDDFNILTLKCASRHSLVQFFDIGASKSGPNMVCFLHLDLEVCFAARACNYWFLIWPHGSTPALASVLFDPPKPGIIAETHCFTTFLTFRHRRLLASDSFSFSLLFFSLLLFSSHLSILSDVWPLNFLWPLNSTPGTASAIHTYCITRTTSTTSQKMFERFYWIECKDLSESPASMLPMMLCLLFQAQTKVFNISLFLYDAIVLELAYGVQGKNAMMDWCQPMMNAKKSRLFTCLC